MRKSIAIKAVGWKDGAIRGPVRAGVAQILQLMHPELGMNGGARSASASRLNGCLLAMQKSVIGRLSAAISVVILLTGFAGAAPRTAPPDIGAVTRAVEAHFAKQPDYQPGDLITRSQIEQVLTKLADAGAPVPNADKIAELGLDDNSFVARELATTAGRTFMRKLARNPGTFAHLDRLSKIPRGEQLIRDLVRDKGGDTLIEYLATTKGGQNMGRMMAAVPDGVDLNKPTGRIYTVADFVAAIKAAFEKTSH
jgi:hypothetical protein